MVGVCPVVLGFYLTSSKSGNFLVLLKKAPSGHRSGTRRTIPSTSLHILQDFKLQGPVATAPGDEPVNDGDHDRAVDAVRDRSAGSDLDVANHVVDPEVNPDALRHNEALCVDRLVVARHSESEASDGNE